MKKGMLALTVLSCMLLVGAPACRHRKDQTKSPPRMEQPKKAPKNKHPDEKKKKAAKPKQPSTYKKK